MESHDKKRNMRANQATARLFANPLLARIKLLGEKSRVPIGPAHDGQEAKPMELRTPKFLIVRTRGPGAAYWARFKHPVLQREIKTATGIFVADLRRGEAFSGNLAKFIGDQFWWDSAREREAQIVDPIAAQVFFGPMRGYESVPDAPSAEFKEALKVKNLDVANSCLRPDTDSMKNRKKTKQPLPKSLALKLAALVEGKALDDCLVSVPNHYTENFWADLDAAGIAPETPEGKAVFHSLRKSYTTLLQELAGASLAEAQKLSRHSTPTLTSNTYTKTAGKRLLALVDDLGERLLSA